jgi:hypothetical protein
LLVLWEERVAGRGRTRRSEPGPQLQGGGRRERGEQRERRETGGFGKRDGDRAGRPTTQSLEWRGSAELTLCAFVQGRDK